MANEKPLTIQEFARLGGKARAEKLSKEERKQSARKAAEARWARTEKRIDKALDNVESNLNELKKSRSGRRKRKANA